MNKETFQKAQSIFCIMLYYKAVPFFIFCAAQVY
jgi:hypothetical protein